MVCFARTLQTVDSAVRKRFNSAKVNFGCKALTLATLGAGCTMRVWWTVLAGWFLSLLLITLPAAAESGAPSKEPAAPGPAESSDRSGADAAAADFSKATPPASKPAAASASQQKSKKPPVAKEPTEKPSAREPPSERPSGSNDTAPTEGETAASAEEPPVGGGTYVVRLRDLEQRIDELKEQIRRSHTRLSLLSDTILSGGLGGARADITFVNDLSEVFRLDKLLILLDGAVQYNKADDGSGLADQEQIPIFSGSIPPGDHTLQVLVKLRGHGYGVFSYLRGYHFEIKDSRSFTISEGKTINLDIVVFEEGGMTTQVEERPRIRYTERIEASVRSGTKANRKGRESTVKTQSKKAGGK